MAMKLALEMLVDVTLFQLEEAEEAESLAERSGSVVYCWKTTGRWNWLERGFSRVDVLGLVLLPAGLPDTIDMPDDQPEA
jgi:hypothetical protein